MSLPSAKVTAQSITAVVVAIVTAVALHIFDTPLDGNQEEFVAGAVGWIAGVIAGYFKTETNPAESSFAHLPPEVKLR